MPMAYIYKTVKSPKVIMSLVCDKIDQVEATVKAHVKLGSLKPGMIFRLVTGRKPDMASTRIIEAVEQAKTGTSTIRFRASKPKVAGTKPSKG